MGIKFPSFYLEDFESDTGEGSFVFDKICSCENVEAPVVNTTHYLKKNYLKNFIEFKNYVVKAF